MTRSLSDLTQHLIDAAEKAGATDADAMASVSYSDVAGVSLSVASLSLAFCVAPGGK